MWHVSGREDDHVLIVKLGFDVKGENSKVRCMRTGYWLVEEKCIRVGLRKENTLC